MADPPADSREYLLIVTGDITADIRNRAVARASQFIYGSVQGTAEDLTNPFATGYFSEQLDGTGHDALYLNHWPITVVASITDRDDVDLGLTEDTDYFIIDSIAHGIYVGHLLKKNGRWTEGKQNYKVTYTAGFDLANYVPQELKDAIALIAQDILTHKDTPGVTAVKVGEIAYTFGGRAVKGRFALPQEVISLLKPFCRYRFH